eukprot:4824310-Amphidinium_carterae.1
MQVLLCQEQCTLFGTDVRCLAAPKSGTQHLPCLLANEPSQGDSSITKTSAVLQESLDPLPARVAILEKPTRCQ